MPKVKCARCGKVINVFDLSQTTIDKDGHKLNFHCECSDACLAEWAEEHKKKKDEHHAR